MKALTIWQPWASLIMLGAKPHEFRRWNYAYRFPTLVGQRIVVHAGVRPARASEIADLIHRLNEGGYIETGVHPKAALPYLHQWPADRQLPLGSGLGTVVLGKPVKAVDLFKDQVADSDRLDEHVWAWPMTEIQHFEPIIPMRGAQGFWDWPKAAA